MKIENAIQIAAPPSAVWNVTTDVEQWPQWMPTVTAVERVDAGPFVVGSAALIKQPGLPQAKWTVTALKEGKAFTWETRTRGIHFVATHELSPCLAGTRNLLRIDATGFPVLFLWPVLFLSLRNTLHRENTAFKAHCE